MLFTPTWGFRGVFEGRVEAWTACCIDGVETKLDLSSGALASCDDVREHLTVWEERAARGAGKRDTLGTELSDTKFKLVLMSDWKKRVADAAEKAVAAVSQVDEVNEELRKVAETHNKIKGKLREVEAESSGRFILLNNLLVKQALMDKVLHGVVEQSASVYYGFIKRRCGELVDSFLVCLEKV